MHNPKDFLFTSCLQSHHLTTFRVLGCVVKRLTVVNAPLPFRHQHDSSSDRAARFGAKRADTGADAKLGDATADAIADVIANNAANNATADATADAVADTRHVQLFPGSVCRNSRSPF